MSEYNFDFDFSKIKNEVWIGENEDDKEEVQEYESDISKIANECYIDKLVKENNKDIGFDLSLLKRNELYVNLIYFDINISNRENYRYYNNFNIDVVGGFQGIDKLDILERYLEALKIKEIPFIVISSGSSGKDIIPICKKYFLIFIDKFKNK